MARSQKYAIRSMYSRTGWMCRMTNEECRRPLYANCKPDCKICPHCKGKTEKDCKRRNTRY